MMAMIPIVSAGIQCQVSPDNSTWANFSTTCYGGCIDEAATLAYVQNLNDSATYHIRCKNETTSWGYLTVKTESGGESVMASLAVMLFALAVVGLCFSLPFMLKKFAKNAILDGLLKRLTWMIGLFLLTLTSVIAVNISNEASLGIEEEIFIFMRIINWAIYLFMVYIVLSFLFDTIKLVQTNAKKHRMGEDE